MNILYVNMTPAYGLNVHDMLKHKNLVMTKAAVEHIEEKLLFAQRRLDVKQRGASSRVGSDVEMPTKFFRFIIVNEEKRIPLIRTDNLSLGSKYHNIFRISCSTHSSDLFFT